MAVSSALGNGAGGRNVPEKIQLPQSPKLIEVRIQNKKIEKTKEVTGPVPGPQFLTKPESAQVVRKFEPLPPVLQKALDGNRVMRHEFQEIGRLTQPSAPPPASKDLKPSSVVAAAPRPALRETVHLNSVQPEPAPQPTPPAHEMKVGQLSKTLIKVLPEPKQPAVDQISQKSLSPPTREKGTAGVVGVAVHQEKPRVLAELTPANPRIENQPPVGKTQFKPTPAEPRETPRLVQPISQTGGEPAREIHEPAPARANLIGTPASKAPAEKVEVSRGVAAAPRSVSAQTVEKTHSSPRLVKPAVVEINRVPVSEPRPRHIDESKNPTQESITQSIFSPKILVPQTTVQITRSNETSTTVTLGSRSEAPRPVVLLTGKPSPSPRKIEEQNQKDFERQLQAGSIQNFVVLARQTVQLQEVHPLPPQISAEEGHIAQPILTNPVNSPFKTETVARNPLHEDNGPQVLKVREPQDLNQSPVIKPVEKNVPRAGEDAVPRLTNLDRLRRILPTNVKARLLPVPAVNILDLVL